MNLKKLVLLRQSLLKLLFLRLLKAINFCIKEILLWHIKNQVVVPGMVETLIQSI